MGMARTIHCPRCHVVIASRLGPPFARLWTVRQGEQQVVMQSLVAIRCACGYCWRPPEARTELSPMDAVTPGFETK